MVLLHQQGSGPCQKMKGMMYIITMEWTTMDFSECQTNKERKQKERVVKYIAESTVASRKCNQLINLQRE